MMGLHLVAVGLRVAGGLPEFYPASPTPLAQVPRFGGAFSCQEPIHSKAFQRCVTPIHPFGGSAGLAESLIWGRCQQGCRSDGEEVGGKPPTHHNLFSEIKIMTTHAITEFQIATDDELMAANGSGLGTLVARRVIPVVLPLPAGTPGPQPNPGDAEPQQCKPAGQCCPNWSLETPRGLTFTKY